VGTTLTQQFTARRISTFVTCIYAVTLGVLLSAALVNPDGNVGGTPAFLLTLPWSLVQAFRQFSLVLSTLIIILGGILNSVLAYLFLKLLVRRFGLWASIATLTIVVLPVTLVVWILNSAEVDNLVRIANGGQNGGIYLATDENGIRALSETIGSPLDIPGPNARGRLTFIPNGTKGRHRGTKFLLKGGRLVDPYPANSYDMVRDGAIEVERIKITEGPNQGLEGWVAPYNLRRVLNLYSM